MGLYLRCIHLLTLAWVVLPSRARFTPFQEAGRQQHREAMMDEQRQRHAQKQHRVPEHRVLTYITPSPGASPVAVTKESQIVTSFVPQFTLCELPPIAEIPISAGASYVPSNGPYTNYSVSIPTGTGTCTTIFTPTVTMVCATTLKALDQRYTVTNCDEDLTFSTRFGYALTTPSPTASPSNNTASITAAPCIETLTTYYLAPWQQLTAGRAPSDVDLKVCRTFSNGTTECVLQYQSWETSLVTHVATTVTTINISTTIHGSSQIIVETFVANVTEAMTTFSMSTTMALEYQTAYTTTNSANRTSASMVPMSTGPTVYETLTLEKASSKPSASASVPSSQNTTGTTTVRITSTVFGTSTVTVSGSPVSMFTTTASSTS